MATPLSSAPHREHFPREAVTSLPPSVALSPGACIGLNGNFNVHVHVRESESSCRHTRVASREFKLQLYHHRHPRLTKTEQGVNGAERFEKIKGGIKVGESH